MIPGPLLTIAIPTYNRASYLQLTLQQLHRELGSVPTGTVEVIVSNNASTDATADVVAASIASGLDLRVVHNATNVGPDANMARAFTLARGRYVLLLGDDDVLVDGALEGLLPHLADGRHGVVCLRPYGYADDFRAEHPGDAGGDDRVFTAPGPFLAEIGQLVTLISALVINKELLAGIEATEFEGDNLVQVHLALEAALRARTNLYVRRYWLACKRNNSGGYDFPRVFVENLWRVFDRHARDRVSPRDRRAIERHFLIGYYPFYLMRQRRAGELDLPGARRRFAERFPTRPAYWLWDAPILYLPRPLAVAWGALATATGRVIYGDLQRGVAFVRDRFISRRR